MQGSSEVIKWRPDISSEKHFLSVYFQHYQLKTFQNSPCLYPDYLNVLCARQAQTFETF